MGCKFCRIGGFCEECFDGYYLDGDECVPCFGNKDGVPRCQLCNQGRNVQCNQCFEGYQLVQSYLCVDCEQEQQNCLVCDINDDAHIICKVCKNGYYLIKQADFEGKCAKCPDAMTRCYQNDGNNYQLIEPIPTQCPDQQYLVHQVVNTEKVVCTSALLDNECYVIHHTHHSIL